MDQQASLGELWLWHLVRLSLPSSLSVLGCSVRGAIFSQGSLGKWGFLYIAFDLSFLITYFKDFNYLVQQSCQPEALWMRHTPKWQIFKSMTKRSISSRLPWVGRVGALHRPKIKALDRNCDLNPSEANQQHSVVVPDDLRAAQNMSNYSLEVNTSYYSFNGNPIEYSFDINTSVDYFESIAHVCDWAQDISFK